MWNQLQLDPFALQGERKVRRQLVSVLMLTLIITSMLSTVFLAKSSFAGDDGSLPSNRNLVENTGKATSTNSSLTQGVQQIQGKTSPNQGQTLMTDGDTWNFSDPSVWDNSTYLFGNTTRLVVGFEGQSPPSLVTFERITAEHKAKIVDKVVFGNETRALVVELPLSSVVSFVSDLKTVSWTSYVEPVMKDQALFVPNDPLWSSQWGPQKVGADYAWNITVGSNSVLVAVIDTGIDYTHPDIAPNYAPLGYDWANNDPDPKDDFGHGTHCAGIIAAVLNNSVGIAGLAQVRIMSEKVLDNEGSGWSDWLANGIAHAVDQGANVLSISLGGYGDSEIVHDAIKYAYSKGALVVAAAGNSNSDVKPYPAGYDEVVAVAATDQNDNKAYFSNFGDWIELAAPGVNILSTMPTYHVTMNDEGYSMNYAYMSGTSMACPCVSGVAALVWSQYANRTRDWLRTWLRYTADDLGDPGFDEYYGYGRVDARKAVEEAAASHDLAVLGLETPPYVEPGTTAALNVTVLNFGQNDESDVEVQLYANDMLVDTASIGFLSSLNSSVASLSWSPTVEGSYNVTVYVQPVPGETNLENNAFSKFIYVGTPVKAVVLRSTGNVIGEVIASWQTLNTQWQLFGDKMVYVDYTTLNKEGITYEDIAGTEADVLIISCAYTEEFTDSEVAAITRYVQEGHGLIITAGTFYYMVPANNKLAPLVGINDSITWTATETDFLQLLNASHPLFNNVPSPLILPVVGTALPSDELWDSSVLAGGKYVAIGHYQESAIVTYRGLVYISPWLEVIPPYYQYPLQLFYNAIIWSRYQKPQHELEVSIQAPRYVLPGGSTMLNLTVSNTGLNNETNVELDLLIDGTAVYSTTIPELLVGESETASYYWTPTTEKNYNVTAYSPPIPGEEYTGNNVASANVYVGHVRFVLWDDITHDNDGDSLNGNYLLIDQLLSANGFIVDELKSGPIDPGKLAGYDILVLMDPELDFSPSEIIAIQKWVAGGGALIAVPDGGWPPSFNTLLAPYGVVLTGGAGGYGITSDIVKHPITQNVTSIYVNWVQDISAETPSKCLAWVSDLYGRHAFLSTTTRGDVVVISDSNIMDNDGLGMADNAQLMLNIFNYAGIRWAHELAVTLEAPGFLEPGTSTTLNATVTNYGLSNETDVELQLLLNGTVVDSAVIPELQTETSSSLNYSWAPVTEGSYNVIAYAPPVPGEEATDDNVASMTVIVRHFIARVAVLNSFEEPSYFIGGLHNNYQPMVDALNAQGFMAQAVTNEEIIDGTLSSFDVFVMVDNVPNDAAVPAVADFWRGGGGLVGFDSAICFFCYAGILPSESAGSNGFGTYWDYVTSSQGKVSVEHPVTNGYTVGQIVDGTGGDAEYSVSALRATSAYPYYTKLAEDLTASNEAYASAYQPASTCGRTVHIWDEQNWENSELQLMILNAVAWTAKPRYDHDLEVALEAPTSLMRGDSALLNCTVQNAGLNNETNVQLHLLLNGSIVDSTMIPGLGVGQSYDMSYFWTPMDLGDYNVTAYAPPLLGEEYTVDNNVTLWSQVQGIHDVAITNVEPSSHQVLVGDSVDVNVGVENEGDYPENFTVTAYASQGTSTMKARITSNGTRIYLDPSEYIFNSKDVSVGYRFNVTLRVADVENLCSFQLSMYYNGSMINATRWFEPTWDPEYVFYNEPTVPAEDFRTGNILVFAGLIGNQPSFNGDGKLCIVEFEIVNLPPPGIKYSCPLSINNDETFLLDTDVNEIPAAKEDGYYEVSSESHPGGYVIGSVMVSLGPGETMNLVIPWDTRDMSPGDYRISGYASVVLGETHVEDNVFSDGVVSIFAHDVAVVAVTPYAHWVFQGLNVNISVEVENKGSVTENVTVTLYYNITANQTIGVLNTSVLPGENQTVTFTWNTVGVPYCHNYTMTAVASIPFDSNPEDNTLAGGEIKVRIMGDLNDDGKVDGRDISLAAWSFGSYPGHPRWNPDADINADGKIDGKDIVKIARNFGTCAS
jgi:thermitase